MALNISYTNSISPLRVFLNFRHACIRNYMTYILLYVYKTKYFWLFAYKIIYNRICYQTCSMVQKCTNHMPNYELMSTKFIDDNDTKATKTQFLYVAQMYSCLIDSIDDKHNEAEELINVVVIFESVFFSHISSAPLNDMDRHLWQTKHGRIFPCQVEQTEFFVMLRYTTPIH